MLPWQLHSYFSSARVNNEVLSSVLVSPSALSASGQNIAFPPVALWVTVGLAVCLLMLLVALAAVCRRKIKESCEEARREGRPHTQGVPSAFCDHLIGDDSLGILWLNMPSWRKACVGTVLVSLGVVWTMKIRTVGTLHFLHSEP